MRIRGEPNASKVKKCLEPSIRAELTTSGKPANGLRKLQTDEVRCVQ